MKTTILHLLALCSVLFAGACGGSGNGLGDNAAIGKTFDYGAPAAPTSSEQGAATVAQLAMSESQSFSAAPDQFTGGALVTFVDFLAAEFFDSQGLGLSTTPLAAFAGRVVRSPAQSASCATQSGNTVTFTNCHGMQDGITVTLNGSISATAGTVRWNITGGFAGTDPSGVSGNVSLHEGGTLAVTLSGIKGNATSEFGGTLSGSGRTINFAFSTAALIDLTHTLTPSYCVNGGGLELKRVWTQRPSGVSGTSDLGVKVAWSGCGNFTVAHSR